MNWTCTDVYSPFLGKFIWMFLFLLDWMYSDLLLDLSQRLGHRPSTIRFGQTIWCMRREGREQLPWATQHTNVQRACATSRVEGSGSLKGLTDPFEPSKSLLDCVIEAPIFGAHFWFKHCHGIASDTCKGPCKIASEFQVSRWRAAELQIAQKEEKTFLDAVEFAKLGWWHKPHLHRSSFGSRGAAWCLRSPGCVLTQKKAAPDMNPTKADLKD